jgi:hypothetical protein
VGAQGRWLKPTTPERLVGDKVEERSPANVSAMRIRVVLLASAVASAALVGATPAQAEDLGYTVTPTTTTASGSIELRSTIPCEVPEAPATDVIVRAEILEWSGRGSWTWTRPVNGDRSWGWTMVLPGPQMRNGRYLVVVTCEEGLPNAPPDDHDPYYFYDPVELDISSADGQPDPVTRLAGSDRIATAIGTSQDVFAAGSVDAAVLGRADAFADSIAGTPLAGSLGWPLLLTGRDALDARTSAELKRLFTGVQDRLVVLLGGTNAISSHVEDQLKGLGIDVLRMGGVDRYATAAKVASSTPNVARILLADGNDFRDGLVAGAAARSDFWAGTGDSVLLLTNGAQMPEPTATFISAHPQAARFAIGAAAAKADPRATAVVGSDWASTSVAVAQRFFPSAHVVGLATRASFADALTGGLHAALTGAPLLYTDVGALPPSVDGYLRQNRSGIVAGYVYGGTAAVSDQVRAAVVSNISG